MWQYNCNETNHKGQNECKNESYKIALEAWLILIAWLIYLHTIKLPTVQTKAGSAKATTE